MLRVRERGLVGVGVISFATSSLVQAWQAKHGLLSTRESRNKAQADESSEQLPHAERHHSCSNTPLNTNHAPSNPA